MKALKLNGWTLTASVATLWAVYIALSGMGEQTSYEFLGSSTTLAVIVSAFWYVAIRKSLNKKVYWLRVLALLVVFFGSMGLLAYRTQPSVVYESKPLTRVSETKPPTTSELLKLVNAERNKAGVAPLVVDDRLNQTAQYKADEIVLEKRYEHKNKAGVPGYTYARDAVRECIYVSENLNNGDTSKHFLKTWLASQPHKEAMLDAKYDLTGIGLAKDGEYYYAVQHFCDLP